MATARQEGTYRFDGISFDPRTGDLARPDGSTVRLRPQAATVLRLLLERGGTLVERAEIQKVVWAGTVVELDQGLNACVREIRRALGDTAADPRYVETLPRRGYRFLAPVEIPAPAGDVETGPPDVPASPPRPWMRQRRSAALVAVGGAAAVLTMLLALGIIGYRDSTPAPRLLVIPFHNASGAPSGDTLAHLLSDRLIAHLSRADPERLAVLARASSLHWAGRSDPLASVVEELGADLALEGSIVRDQGHSLELRLLDTRTEAQVWSRSFDVDRSDLAGTLDAIGRAVARTVDPGLLVAFDEALDPAPHASRIRDTALRVDYLLALEDEGATARADSLLTAALEEHGEHPRLSVGRAEVLLRQGELDRARRLAKDVLRSTSSAEAHRILAQLAQREMAWDEAEGHIRRAVELAPGDPRHLHVASFVAAYRGQRDASIDLMRRAQALDPVSADLIADAGFIFIWARDWGEAEDRCRAALALRPEHVAALRCLIDLAWLTDSPERGEAAARSLLSLVDVDVPTGSTAVGEYWRRMSRLDRDTGCGKVWRSKGLLVLGRAEDAARALRAVDHSPPECLPAVAVDPFFEALRRDPDVQDALRSAGLRTALAPH